MWISDNNDVIRKYETMCAWKNMMVKAQKRYSELLILIKHTSGTNKDLYEDELRENKRSHYTHISYFNRNQELLDMLKKSAETHDPKVQPNLTFIEDNNIIQDPY